MFDKSFCIFKNSDRTSDNAAVEPSRKKKRLEKESDDVNVPNLPMKSKFELSAYSKYFSHYAVNAGKISVKCIVKLTEAEECGNPITLQPKSYSNLARHLKVHIYMFSILNCPNLRLDIN